MMDIRSALAAAGAFHVVALDAAEAVPGEQGTLILACFAYAAEDTPGAGQAWIHPYYFVSQRAYRACAALVEAARAEGVDLRMADEIRVKPIFARLAGFSQGRNTLSYVQGIGSRFHVQILLTAAPMTVDVSLAEHPHPLQCGDCRRCQQACPTGALAEDGFHRERCLRNWMLSGKPVPEALRGAMGSRLIGCDECQRCCPHNPPPKEACAPVVSLDDLLTQPKPAATVLKDIIGTNLALPNRVLAQACLLAGNTRDTSLLPALTALKQHPSPAVADHASWAIEQING